MRTKCRAVPRPRGEPMLEDGVSVSASRDLHSVRCPTLEGFQQASMVVNGLDVYAHSISQRVVTGVDVVPMSERAPNGISIHEPETGHTMVPDGLLDAPVTGKGKRNVNDVRLYEVGGTGSCNADASSSFLSPVTSYQYIKPSDIGKAIHVKVYRKWTITPIIGSRRSILCLILLDQQGGAIQANAQNPNRIRFDNILQINGTYTITDFGLMETKTWMQTLPNRLTLILGSLTDAQPFSGTSFPAHHFNFAVYNELATRADNDDVILTDYIGCVMDVGDVRDVGNATQEKIAWRDTMLRDPEGNKVTLTLWNEKAKTFNTGAYEDAAKPTIMAVSSCWVKTYGGLQLSSSPATYYYFNPNIPETDYILCMLIAGLM